MKAMIRRSFIFFGFLVALQATTSCSYEQEKKEAAREGQIYGDTLDAAANGAEKPINVVNDSSSSATSADSIK